MATNIIMPALELAQETGKVLHWLKRPGDAVQQGRADRRDRDRQSHRRDRGAGVRRAARRDGERGRRGAGRADDRAHCGGRGDRRCARHAARQRGGDRRHAHAAGGGGATGRGVKASPLARKIAEQHGVDLARVTTASGRIEKADVLAYVESQKSSASGNGRAGRRVVGIAEGAPPRRRARARYRRRCGARARAAPSWPTTSRLWRAPR